MLYKFSLNEDVYSMEHIDELVACIRSSISGYVELLGPNKNNTFSIIWNSDLNQKVTVSFTDEHDKYGVVPLEFNLYIDGEEFGPMCYTSIEIATMETKDFILSKLHKKFMEPKLVSESITNEDEPTPYTYRQVFDELKLGTMNFTVKGDTIRYYFESEAEHAEKILSKHYSYVKSRPHGDWIEITFSTTNPVVAEAFPKLSDYIVDDSDNSQYIGNARVIKVSQLPKVGEKFKAGTAISVAKVGFEEGHLIYEVLVTESDSLQLIDDIDINTSRWLFAIKNFNEALERDNDHEEELNEFAYRIDDLKQFYNTATGIDKTKFPNFFAWFDEMKKSGKLNSIQPVTN